MGSSGSAVPSANYSTPLAASPAKRRSGGHGGWEERSDALRRLGRRVKPFEHFGALGLFVLTAALVFLLLLRLVHSDYYGVAGLAWESGPAVGGGGGCDWFEGEWVWDEGYPLYESVDCPFLDEGFRCSENGRPDRMYTKWRWQPAGCDLPRSHFRDLIFFQGFDILFFTFEEIFLLESMLHIFSPKVSAFSSSIVALLPSRFLLFRSLCILLYPSSFPSHLF